MHSNWTLCHQLEGKRFSLWQSWAGILLTSMSRNVFFFLKMVLCEWEIAGENVGNSSSLGNWIEIKLHKDSVMVTKVHAILFVSSSLKGSFQWKDSHLHLRCAPEPGWIVWSVISFKSKNVYMRLRWPMPSIQYCSGFIRYKGDPKHLYSHWNGKGSNGCSQMYIRRACSLCAAAFCKTSA